jgi:FliI/YscN family ATPase
MRVTELVEHQRHRQRARLAAARLIRGRAQVQKVSGWLVETSPLLAGEGEQALVQGASGAWHSAVVVEASRAGARLLLLEAGPDLRPGLPVETLAGPVMVPVGPAVLGRVLDPLGRPLDEGPPPAAEVWRPVFAPPPQPLDRRAPAAALWTGVRALDALATACRGQRLGIIGPAGTGKTMLLRMICAWARADVVVLGLVGERGREIFEAADLLRRQRPHSVVIATGPEAPPPLRRLAAYSATAIAEHFRDQGAHVLLAIDSLTRFAYAQREIGLALGELPATHAYPPSVFWVLPQLIERAGPARRGTITAYYTFLLESEELTDPLVEAALASLDGHLMLSRELANRGLYPPLDLLRSLSRMMDQVVDAQHRAAVQWVRERLQAYQEARALVETGLYRPGSNPLVDAGVGLWPRLEAFIRQRPEAPCAPQATRAALLGLVGK